MGQGFNPKTCKCEECETGLKPCGGRCVSNGKLYKHNFSQAKIIFSTFKYVSNVNILIKERANAKDAQRDLNAAKEIVSKVQFNILYANLRINNM